MQVQAQGKGKVFPEALLQEYAGPEGKVWLSIRYIGLRHSCDGTGIIGISGRCDGGLIQQALVEGRDTDPSGKACLPWPTGFGKAGFPCYRALHRRKGGCGDGGCMKIDRAPLWRDGSMSEWPGAGKTGAASQVSSLGPGFSGSEGPTGRVKWIRS